MDMPSPARDKTREVHCSHVGALNGMSALMAEDSEAGATPRSPGGGDARPPLAGPTVRGPAGLGPTVLGRAVLGPAVLAAVSLPGATAAAGVGRARASSCAAALSLAGRGPVPLLAGHQRWALAATTPDAVQTLPGLSPVILQIAAVMRFAAPRAFCATLLLGSCRAEATCAQDRPARVPGS